MLYDCTLIEKKKKITIARSVANFQFRKRKVKYWIEILNYEYRLESANLVKDKHRVKSVRIRSYSGPTYSVSVRIQSECGKIRTRITPTTETFYAVKIGAKSKKLRGFTAGFRLKFIHTFLLAGTCPNYFQ